LTLETYEREVIDVVRLAIMKSHDLFINSHDFLLKMAAELEEMERRETQRRHDAEEEYSNVLPPDVTAVLTEADEKEQSHGLSHNGCHKKTCEVRRKLGQGETKTSVCYIPYIVF